MLTNNISVEKIYTSIITKPGPQVDPSFTTVPLTTKHLYATFGEVIFHPF